MTNRTLLKAIRKAQRAQSSEAEEYKALEQRMTFERAQWTNDRGSPDGFYEAHKADMDRLQDLYHAMNAHHTSPKAKDPDADPNDRALIQLWLPLGQREAFRALCTKQGLSLSSKLRAMIATELGQ